jgi:hypothetical protein
MRTGIAKLPYNVRVTSQLILTEGRAQTQQTSFSRRVSSLKAQVTEANGFNCTQIQSPCRIRKVGTLTMRRNAVRHGQPVPLFVNLVVDTHAKRSDARPGDNVRVLTHGGLEVARYAASLKG